MSHSNAQSERRRVCRPAQLRQHSMTHRAALALLGSALLAASCVDFVGPDTTPTVPPPTTPGRTSLDWGLLRVVVTTAGTDLDPDGYTPEVTPALQAYGAMPTSGGVEFPLPIGTYVVTLGGVAPNCAIAPQSQGGTTLQIELPPTAEKQVTFAVFNVTCVPIPVARLSAGTQLAFVRRGQIWRVNADGSDPVQLTTGPGDADPAWSPDGRRIAFTRGTDREVLQGRPFGAIHVMDADGSNVVQLTQGPTDHEPAWSPDGRRLAFASRCGGQGCVLVASADPTDTSRVRVGWPQGEHHSPAWSPDGSRIAFTSSVALFDMLSDLYVATLGGTSIAQLTSIMRLWNGDSPIHGYEEPAWSPAGRQLAVIGCPPSFYVCDANLVSVMNADGTGQHWLASRGAAGPAWSPDGRTIAFAAGGSIQWIRVDGTERGIIVENGYSPAWRWSLPGQ